MKIHLIILILIVSIFHISCNTNINESDEKESVNSEKRTAIDKSIELIKEGYTIQSKNGYLSDKLLIAKKGKLKGYKSLNIKGHRLYELDKNGNIRATYDISNNYSVYTYDQINRLIKSENKQHNPPEVYNTVEYKYSKTDSVTEVITISYKNNEPIKSETKNEEVSLSKEDVKKIYFEDRRISDFYMNLKNNKIIAYEDEMVFCCGVIMKGKNKLIYHINENELIDSLIIIGMENGEKNKFEYKYE